MADFYERPAEVEIPPHIVGLDYVVEHMGPQVVAEALGIDTGLPTEDIVAQFTGSFAPLPAGRSIHGFIKHIGTDAIAEALEVPYATAPVSLVEGLMLVAERPFAIEAGLGPKATRQQIYDYKAAQNLQAAIAAKELPEGSDWETVGRASLTDGLGLPRYATNEMIEVAQGLGTAEEWANADHKPAVYPEPAPGGTDPQDWNLKNLFES